MTDHRFDNIRCVLVETSHPGNIGAAARAMKTMGLARLYLVRPGQFPHADATARAAGAQDLLSNAVVCDCLDAALRGCSLVIGSSARPRTLPWPQLNPRECAAKALSEPGETALVFGRERTGLSNEELDRCHYLGRIPCNTEYGSLNLAAAVQIFCYEFMMTSGEDGGSSPALPDGPWATADETERFYRHLEQTLIELDFLDPDNPRHLMRRLRRLFNRVRLSRNEANILRGILTAAQKGRGKGR